MHHAPSLSRYVPKRDYTNNDSPVSAVNPRTQAVYHRSAIENSPGEQQEGVLTDPYAQIENWILCLYESINHRRL